MRTKDKRNLLLLQDADKKLKMLCKKGLREKFGSNVADFVKNRIEYELKVVAKNNHSSYYLLASMLAKEAKRLKHTLYFRGTISSSLIAYTGGFSQVNPMEQEYGGVSLVFETTREEYDGWIPYLDVQCSMGFVLYAQSYLSREFPEYRLLSYPLSGDEEVRSIRLYMVKDGELPDTDSFEMRTARIGEYPDFMFMDDFFHITLIGSSDMDLVRYNTFYNDGQKGFDENALDTRLIQEIWKYEKKNTDCLKGFKRLKVNTYEELITVMGLALSTGAWDGIAKRMIKDGSLSLKDMIGSRDDLFYYLKKIGFDAKEAYAIMERVRKGKHLTADQYERMKEYGAEEWVLDLCEHVLYLMPRAHVAQIIRRDAYCLTIPQEFKDSMPNVYQMVTKNAFV